MYSKMKKLNSEDKKGEEMQEILLKALESICGEPVYKTIYKDANGNEVARPVFAIPERYRRKG